MSKAISGSFSGEEWDQLREVLLAGLAADAPRFKNELLALNRAFPGSRRSCLYLWYALRYEVAKILGRRPTSADLSALAQTRALRYKMIVNLCQQDLDDLLHLVFELRPAGETSSGTMLIVNGAAALGVLIKDQADLDEIQGHLALWYDSLGAETSVLDPPDA